MNELLKYLIERLKNRPITAELLLIASIFVVVFSVAQYFVAKPESILLLKNCYFQAIAIIVFCTWFSSFCWRYARERTLRIIATITFLAIGMTGATWVIRSSNIEQLKIRIIFDESVDMSPEMMTKLISVLQSKLFYVEMSDKAYPNITSIEEGITDNEVRTLFHEHNLLKSKEDQYKPLPVLITGKMLKSSFWSNLLLTAWDDAIVISIWNVGSTASLSDVKVRRYVATSVAFWALVAHAFRRDKEILEDRPPNIIKGCLYDFHRTRQTYILQCQEPALCDLEEKALTKIFGGATVKILKDIFDSIARDGQDSL